MSRCARQLRKGRERSTVRSDFIRTFLPYVRLMVSAIRSKTRPRGSSYLCPCNDSFYSRMHAACDCERARMHCPHKSVNQTSLTRRYWCLAATGAERCFSWRAANRPRCSRPAPACRLMNRDSYGNVRFTRARDSIILKPRSSGRQLRAHSLRMVCEGYDNAGDALPPVNCTLNCTSLAVEIMVLLSI